MLDPSKHNYFPKLKKLFEQSKLPVGPLTEVTLYHDDWCAVHRVSIATAIRTSSCSRTLTATRSANETGRLGNALLHEKRCYFKSSCGDLEWHLYRQRG
jgi:hypothetical protein